MKSNIFMLVIVILPLVIMALVGCFPNLPLPDLVPDNPPGMAGYCNVDDSNNLIVYVKNQGEADAPASSVKVQFNLSSGVQEFFGTVEAIPVGETKSVSFAIPFGCFNPDCDFTITVDSNENVLESEELNNSANGSCVG